MLQLQGVTKLYNGQPGASDVTIKIPQGSRTVIVGPSGSGKTTLLRLIAGFEQPDRGQIVLDGQALAGQRSEVPPHRRQIAYVPQEGALFPHMSVGANIGFALPRNIADRAPRIDNLMERVGLAAAMRDRRPHQLSGGQQQRVALARALAQQPRLMLLDEPFSALDTGLRDAMRAMIGEVLSQSGITAVLVTHDQGEALAFADHLVVMRDGIVVDAGPPQRLYRQPVDIETARFLGEAIILPASIKDAVATTPLGPIPIVAGDSASTIVLLRPEQIIPGVPLDRLDDDTPSLHIRHRTFCGSHWKILVALEPADDETTFTIGTTADLHPGDRVSFRIAGAAHPVG